MSDEIDEIWQLFADDGGQSLDTVEEILLFCKANPTGEADVGALFRAMHTFKGNSRVLGLGVIESRAHLAEDLIGLVRDDGVPLGPELLELLLETVDALRGMLETTLASRRDGEEATTLGLAYRMRAMFKRCKEGDAPKATFERKPSQPAAQHDCELEPETQAKPRLDEGLIFEPVPQASLAEDSMYRKIFAGMAGDLLCEMRRAVDEFVSAPGLAQAALTGEAERLRFAANQIGMSEWRDTLAEFVALGEPSIEQTQSLMAKLTAMLARDFGAPDAPPASEKLADGPVSASDDPVRVFFDALEPILAVVRDADERLGRGDAGNCDNLGRVVDEIKALSEPMGFTRLAGVAESFLTANGDLTSFRRAKIRFYEELASIVDGGSVDPKELRIRPLTELRAWCAEGVSKALLDMRSVLDQMRLGVTASEANQPISELLRLVFHACGHHKMEMAAQFCMALLDLFARAENGDMPADPVLQHIARSFVGAMELAFDAAKAGGSADMSALEALFQEAATATFASSSHIEARLGLPRTFHNLLSPESVKMALTAMDDGLLFYIVRADLSNDELASGFSSWISSGEATVISNVTVFQDNTTLFDFLIASPLNETALAEVVARLDPGGRVLKVEMSLKDRDANEGGKAAPCPR